MVLSDAVLDILKYAFGAALVLLSVFQVFLPLFKRKKNRQMLENQKAQEEAPVEGTLKELAESEEFLNRPKLDLREQMHKDFVLIDGFETFQGFSSGYMTTLVEKLRAANVNSFFHHKESLQLGVASATITPGVYELWVEKEKIDLALPIVKELVDISRR
jgi:hypothetical protein